MSKNIGLDILLLCDLVLPDWQNVVEMNRYESLKDLVIDIYGTDVWEGLCFFGGIDTLKTYWIQKRSQCQIEFSNYILDFFSEDYAHIQNHKFCLEGAKKDGNYRVN